MAIVFLSGMMRVYSSGPSGENMLWLPTVSSLFKQHRSMSFPYGFPVPTWQRSNVGVFIAPRGSDFAVLIAQAKQLLRVPRAACPGGD